MATLSGASMIHLFYISSMIHGHTVYCLVDSGSTHNFINTRMVDRCGLQAQNFPRINVTVANGLTLQCVKGIPQLSIGMKGYTLIDDFYMGVQWLQYLGRYNQVFRARQLEFMVGRRKIVLKECPFPSQGDSVRSMIID